MTIDEQRQLLQMMHSQLMAMANIMDLIMAELDMDRLASNERPDPWGIVIHTDPEVEE